MRRTLAIFVLTFAVIVGVGAALTSVQAPTRHPACPPLQPCGVPAPTVKPLVALSVFRSAQSGFSLEYDGSLLTIAHQDGAGVTLRVQFKDGTTGAMNVQAAPGISPSAAIAARVKLLQGSISQLARDDDPADELLGAEVGLRSGSGAVFRGDLAGPQGVSQSVQIAIESATNGRRTLLATVLAPAQHVGPQSAMYALADQIINSVRWAEGTASS